jgi:hypothetical protein
MMLSDLIRKMVRTHMEDDPRDLADRLLSETDHETLRDALARAIDHEQRDFRRAVERRAFNGGRLRTYVSPDVVRESLGVAAAHHDGWAALLRTSFRLGDGAAVTWGQATVEQHRLRIEFLERMRAGISATIDQHNEAIALIEESEAQCLDEVWRGVEKAA